MSTQPRRLTAEQACRSFFEMDNSGDDSIESEEKTSIENEQSHPNGDEASPSPLLEQFDCEKSVSSDKNDFDNTSVTDSFTPDTTEIQVSQNASYFVGKTGRKWDKDPPLPSHT